MNLGRGNSKIQVKWKIERGDIGERTAQAGSGVREMGNEGPGKGLIEMLSV